MSRFIFILRKTAAQLALLFLIAAVVSMNSCGKNEQENIEPEPANPFELIEKLAKAASEAIEITHYERGISVMTIYLCTPFKYGDSGSSYESISIQEAAFSKYENDHEYLTITFKTGTIVKFRYRNALSIDLAPTTEYKDYQGASREFPFSLLEAGRGNVRFEATTQGKGSTSVTFDEKSNAGILTVTLADEEKATLIATLKVTDGTNSKSYSVTAEAYYCSITADNIIFVGKKEQEHTIEYSITTNLEEYEVVAELAENSFVALNGLTVTTLSDNHTGKERSTTVTLKEKSEKFKEKVITITQEQDEINPDPNSIVFADWNFKNAMLALADLNGDEEITEEEALTVTEINIVDKGVKDLTGLEAFKNVWKFDAQNNDITDATVLKNLPLLYWLDLRGNPDLETFDISSCSHYFQHCWADPTAKLNYTVHNRQLGVYVNGIDRSKQINYIPDVRESKDWSHQNQFHLYRKHTKGNGLLAICITGLGFIDVDLIDGSFRRIMEEWLDKIVLSGVGCPHMMDVLDYCDFYYMERMSQTRNSIEPLEATSEEQLIKDLYTNYVYEEFNLFKDTYSGLFGTNNPNSPLLVIHELNTIPSTGYSGGKHSFPYYHNNGVVYCWYDITLYPPEYLKNCYWTFTNLSWWQYDSEITRRGAGYNIEQMINWYGNGNYFSDYLCWTVHAYLKDAIERGWIPSIDFGEGTNQSSQSASMNQASKGKQQISSSTDSRIIK